MKLNNEVMQMVEMGRIESYSDYCNLHFTSESNKKFKEFKIDQNTGILIFRDNVGTTFDYLKSVKGVIDDSLSDFFLNRIESACYHSLNDPHKYIIENYWKIGLSVIRKMNEGEFFWEQDILQDCALKVSSTLSNNHTNLKGLKKYFLTAVRNAYLSSKKEYFVQNNEDIEKFEGTEYRYDPLRNDPEKDDEAREVWNRVNKNAKEKCKKFIYYFFDVGIKRKDIAEILKVSGGGVTYIWSECLDEIRKMLGIVAIAKNNK